MNEQTILVVEDDDATREGLVELLELHGYQVASEPDGTSALYLLKSGFRPSLILLDMIVPGVDGWQFLDRRDRDHVLAGIPVAIVTGLGIASEEWAESLGACQLLRKPIEIDALLATVRQHVDLGLPGLTVDAALRQKRRSQ